MHAIIQSIPAHHSHTHSLSFEHQVTYNELVRFNVFSKFDFSMDTSSDLLYDHVSVDDLVARAWIIILIDGIGHDNVCRRYVVRCRVVPGGCYGCS